jgi:hypothetical protein
MIKTYIWNPDGIIMGTQRKKKSQEQKANFRNVFKNITEKNSDSIKKFNLTVNQS